MKLTFYSRSLPNADSLSATAILDRVAELGLDGCSFPSPLALSSNLDDAELQSVRAHAVAHGMYIELAVGQINPYHFDARPEVLALGDGDMRAGLERLLRAARKLDCTELMFTVGTLADRFDQSVAWAEHLSATSRFLRSLAPLLREIGCRLCLKTHEEITSFEIVRLIEAIGPDVLGVCFDPVNVLARVEDPVAAARRLEAYVHQVHVDDAVLRWTERGLERWLCPCGDGIVDWPAIFPLLGSPAPDARLTIELHRAFLDMPIFDPAWLTAQPDLTVEEFAEVVRLANASAARPSADAFQTNPAMRLEPTLAYLRALHYQPVV